MNEEFKEKFHKFIDPAKDAVLAERYEEAYSILINGIIESKENSEHEVTDALLSTMRTFTVLIENKYASKLYKDEHFNKIG